MLHLPRIMLAAPSSGSGKTMLTCGILQALKDRGKAPASFKCGPDYIDPMFHTRVLGTPSRNLDTFFSGRDTTRYLFARSARRAGISVMEGVMGFYDGLGGVTKEASSYDLARVTETPVVLVVNAKGMSLSVVPFLKGFVDYQEEQGRVIRGVILNRVTKMTALLLKERIEAETGLKYLGYAPELEACRVESRHLGLVTPGEISDLQSRISALAGELEKSVDFDGLIALAEQAPDYEERELALPESVSRAAGKGGGPDQTESIASGTADLDSESGGALGVTACGRPLRIAVARDEAFCFYYQDNLELLELLGAELAYFSPLHDRALPQEVSGLLLGGGYPELYARALSENKEMLESVRCAIEGGMPYLAECGGFMYLHERMQDMNDIFYPMAGVVPGEAYRTKKLGRFGYITLQTEEDQLLPRGETIRGHEFHYFDSTSPGSDYHAEKPVTGRTWDCVRGTENSACGYPHLYYWSNPEFPRRFIEKAADWAEKNLSWDKEDRA